MHSIQARPFKRVCAASFYTTGFSTDTNFGLLPRDVQGRVFGPTAAARTRKLGPDTGRHGHRRWGAMRRRRQG